MDRPPSNPLLGMKKRGKPSHRHLVCEILLPSALRTKHKKKKETSLEKFDIKSISQRIRYACHGPIWINLNDKAEGRKQVTEDQVQSDAGSRK